MKYLIMMQSNPSFQEIWDRMTDEQLLNLGRRHRALHQELVDSGELVAAEGLDDVALTRRVAVREGRTLVSDGPMAEAKEHLAGFYLIECSAERAVEIAARTPDAEWGEVAGPAGARPGGTRAVTVPPGSSSCCASWRRGCSGCWSGVPATSRPARTRCRRRCWRRRAQWPAEGVPANPTGWLVTVASRRRTELWRNETARRRREVAVFEAAVEPEPVTGVDDTLTLLTAVLPPGADAGVAGRADPARGRRAHHGRDRPGPAGAGADRRAADQPGQAADQGRGRDVRSRRRPRSGRTGSRPCCTCST